MGNSRFFWGTGRCSFFGAAKHITVATAVRTATAAGRHGTCVPHCVLIVTAAVASCLAAGCGEQLVEVNGTVTQGDKPLAEGLVSFDLVEPPGRSARRTAQLENGRFAFQGEQALPPGVYRVTVTAGNPLSIVKQSAGGGGNAGATAAQARGVFVFDRVSVTGTQPELVLRLEEAQQRPSGP